ncbi:C2 domain-containing protein 5-like [Dysidea avara]|uniref:C2 domain-containing protein 5-like n=1 Tax=Dysidea avara TaxID=196820 RepID=UPI0033210144
MPATVKVQVSRARDLPIMDKSSELTDAFAEVKFAGSICRTEVCCKSLNPTWSNQWFKFEVDDEMLQDEPLQIRIMDHDTYTAHDAIGKVYIPLNSLASSDSPVASLSGWYPIFDTLHGIRGEVHVAVKVDVLKAEFSSSLAVQFFLSSCVPAGYSVVQVLGFLEELVVNNDPEYKWIDKIRTPRASNEARQRLFFKLQAELQRKMGTKASVAGGNAVIGYRQSYDLEGETGIVVRGIGSCVRLAKNSIIPFSIPNTPLTNRPEDHVTTSSGGRRCRKTSSSDSSDNIPSPTKPGSLQPVMERVNSQGSGGGMAPHGDISLAVQPSNTFSEFPFSTLISLPEGVITHIGGVVCARAVKLLDKIDNPDDPETRDMWWKEVRIEVRSHAKALGCDTVLGYQETTSICDTLCLLSAIGTAVSVDWSSVLVKPSKSSISSSLDGDQSIIKQESYESVEENKPRGRCAACHIPYSGTQPPFKMQLSKCAVCRKRLVPMVLLSTTEQPEGLITRGKSCLVQARVCHSKKRYSGEQNAINVSKALPFLEYALHRRLLNKLKVKGMNAVFNLKMEVTVGEILITGVSTGTAVFLEALPKPEPLRLDVDPTQPLSEKHQRLNKLIEGNRQRYELDTPSVYGTHSAVTSDSESEEDRNELELSWDRKELMILDLEEKNMKEEDIVDALSEPSLPVGYHVTNSSCDSHITSLVLNSKVVTSICRQTLDTKDGMASRERDCQFSQMLEDAVEVMLFKLRRLLPCWVGSVDFNVDLPDDDLVQVTLTAAVVPLTPGMAHRPKMIKLHHQSQDDLMFKMEDNVAMTPAALSSSHVPVTPTTQTSTTYVNITPLVKLPESAIVRYLGVVSLFLIRETTAVRGLRGVDHFVHMFIAEANAIARAHVAAMNGNMLLGYRVNECVLIDSSSHKNQAQCLLHISGDAALVDHVIPHGTTWIPMMSPPPHAMEPIEPSNIMLQRKSQHSTITSQHQCTEC